MPYTPPSPSPNASLSQSRNSSRSSSFSDVSSPPASVLITPSKPQPTRSTSYLHKHRRSMGGSRSGDEKPFVMPTVGPRSTVPVLHPPRSNSGSSIRQVQIAPMMSTGVVISPPDSSQNSSDDEMENHENRGRQLVNVAELEEAIRNSIPQRRQGSPVGNSNKSNEPVAEPRSPKELSARIHQKISHARSTSDILGSRELAKQLQETVKQQQEKQERGSDESSPDIEDDAYRIAPPMVRKKSGELVKSSLKSPSLKRRPSSMPSTPTYPKVVHFDAHLEHVRHFLHSERPTAVSAGSSPVESAFEHEVEYPFPDEYREPPFEWEIALPNFPERLDRSSWVVRVERVVLSHDKKALLGTVAVANIAFHKFVVARFTLDYWQTTSEVVGEFTNDVRRKHKEDGYDRFTFKVKLEDMTNLENKTLFFCVRYRVADQEFWDNNSAINYQVDFKKKPIPQNGKGGPSSTSSRPLPRSKPSSGMVPRPRSMPIFDDSFDAYDLKSQPEYKMFSAAVDRQMNMRTQPPTSKSSKKMSVADAEALAQRANPSGNVFGNRYDFETSLAAAMATATKVLGPEKSGFQVRSPPPIKSEQPGGNPYFNNLTISGLPRSHSSPALSANITPRTNTVPSIQFEQNTPEPQSFDVLKTIGSESKPSMESTSYRELLDNYCFFGSAKTSPQIVSGSAMPGPKAPPSPPSENENSTALSLNGYRVTGSRSPSPRGLSRSVDGADGSPPFVSAKSSRSPSPSHNAYGFPTSTAFDIQAPSVIQT